MPRHAAIPPALEPDVHRLFHKERKTSGQIVTWLAKEHGITCSEGAVKRALHRAASRDPGGATVDFQAEEAADAAAELAPATPLETAQHWKREAHREARAAKEAQSDPMGGGWKRYHSAIGLVLRAAQLEQVILHAPKRPGAPPPLPAGQTAPGGDSEPETPLSQEERDRLVDAMH